MPKNTKQTTKSPAAPAVIAQPKTRELTEIQRVLVDHCAEMILRGGHEVPISNLITACLGFEYRSVFKFYEQESVDKYVDSYADEWKNRLDASWPSRTEIPDADRSTVTKRVRDDLRGNLREKLSEFCARATPEEVLLMTAVIQDWEGSSVLPSDHLNEPEIALGLAFEYTFGQRLNRYIRVPNKHWKLVQDYLDLLEGKERPKAA